MCTLYRTARDARSDPTRDVTNQRRLHAQGESRDKLRWTTEGGGHGRAGASDNVLLCAGAMGMTQRFIAAGPLSDQDIMPRYRMTPPVRGRCPSMRNAKRCNLRQRERRQKRARSEEHTS